MGLTATFPSRLTMPTAVLTGVYLLLWAHSAVMGLTATLPSCITMPTAVFVECLLPF